MFDSDVTNPRECSVKKLSISWIIYKLNINERTHVWKKKCSITIRLGRIKRKGIGIFEWLRTGNLRGVKFFPVLPRNPDSEQTFIRNKYEQEKGRISARFCEWKHFIEMKKKHGPSCCAIACCMNRLAGLIL